jgi:hypothetical protein
MMQLGMKEMRKHTQMYVRKPSGNSNAAPQSAVESAVVRVRHEYQK